MRLLPFVASAIVTISLVTVLNIQLPVGGSKTPKLGYFLSPQQGFWKNAEKINANFDAHIFANNLKYYLIEGLLCRPFFVIKLDRANPARSG